VVAWHGPPRSPSPLSAPRSRSPLRRWLRRRALERQLWRRPQTLAAVRQRYLAGAMSPFERAYYNRHPSIIALDNLGRVRGYTTPTASTPTNPATGTRTPATATTAGCSSSTRRGSALEGWARRIERRRELNSWLRGGSGNATGDPGANGEPPESAA
jgi:hypothetical protein